MTSVQTQQHGAHPAPTPLIDVMDASGLRVFDDMTVEVALSVMAGARVEYLLLCDGDDQCTGSVTRAQLAVLRDCATYTDRIRLREVLGGPPAPPGSTSTAVGPFSFSL
ncbi:CBS domain-containing protein [Streptomyces sp. NPDC020801]|uniref:CBS domain-containing protein n=1 Tax=unclassified Streptomyces TaxID=2593676 RepID=UPI0037ACF5C5